MLYCHCPCVLPRWEQRQLAGLLLLPLPLGENKSNCPRKCWEWPGSHVCLQTVLLQAPVNLENSCLSHHGFEDEPKPSDKSRAGDDPINPSVRSSRGGRRRKARSLRFFPTLSLSLLHDCDCPRGGLITNPAWRGRRTLHRLAWQAGVSPPCRYCRWRTHC